MGLHGEDVPVADSLAGHEGHDAALLVTEWLHEREQLVEVGEP
jgi:hypothetical protein